MDLRIQRHAGSRGELRHLFALAEDSAAALDAYIDAGTVLVATVGDAVVGHVQLTPTDEGRTGMVVATAAADVGNLRFYQRQGFRLRSIERDAFSAEAGYHGEVIDGIPLRDRVWLDRPVGAAS